MLPASLQQPLCSLTPAPLHACTPAPPCPHLHHRLSALPAPPCSNELLSQPKREWSSELRLSSRNMEAMLDRMLTSTTCERARTHIALDDWSGWVAGRVAGWHLPHTNYLCFMLWLVPPPQPHAVQHPPPAPLRRPLCFPAPPAAPGLPGCPTCSSPGGRGPLATW